MFISIMEHELIKFQVSRGLLDNMVNWSRQ